MQIDRPITIALILFIILLLIFFLVAPEYNTFKKLQTELGQKIAEYDAEFDYYAHITKTYFDLQSRPDDIQKIDDALPENTDIGATVYFLQQTAKANGLIVKNLFLSKSAPASSNNNPNISGGVKNMVFSMELVGDYAALENFIISLEKSSRIFEVTNISFSSQSGPPYNFSLQINTHSY